ncbi:MAG: TonB-dependent receptor [Novosphingobium sp.]
MVTARKRVESILKAPVIESVLTQEMIERAQIRTVNDLVTKTTNVLVGSSTPDVGSFITIRGVGNTSPEPGVDPSASLNVDGLQLAHGTAFTASLFDMEQIEILKGPQALYYGKSSTAGLVSVRTADPGDEFEMIGRLSHEFAARDWRGEAIISLPISESLGIRLAVLHSQSGDYLRNKASFLPETGARPLPANYGDTKTTFFRGTVLLRPSSTFTARLKVNITRDRLTGTPAQVNVSCPDGTGGYADAGGLTAIPFIDPADNCKIGRTYYQTVATRDAFPRARNNGEEFQLLKQEFGSLELNFDLPSSLALTSVTGYYHSTLDALINTGSGSYAAATIESERDFYRKEFIQEVRLNSDWSGPLNLNVGTFYQRATMYDELLTNGNVLYDLPAILAQRAHKLKIRSLSAFGQFLFKPADTIEIAAGARWTHEKRSDFITVTGATGITNPTVPDLSTKNWSPELTITFMPTDDLTLFGSLKQGYKSGSYAFVNVVQGQDNSFKDEKVQGGEIGLKSRLADRQLSLSIAGYYYKYKDLQVGTIVSPPGGGLPQTAIFNAANAKVYGIDFEMTYNPVSVPGLSLRSAVAWNRARFSSFPSAPCWGGQTVAEGCSLAPNSSTGRYTAQDLSDAPLVRAPAWQITAGADYETPVSGDLVLSLGADMQYASRYLTVLGRRDDFYQGAYAKLNGRIGVQNVDKTWQIELLGKNLTDKFTANACSNVARGGGGVFSGQLTGGTTRGPGGIDEVSCYVDRGREVTLRMTLRI